MRAGRRLSRHRRRLLHCHVRFRTTRASPSRTNTTRKSNTKNILGTSGLRKILASLSTSPYASTIKTVCIGGVNAQNLQRILYQSAVEVPGTDERFSLDGVALVSAIVGAQDPEVAARKLVQAVKTPPAFISRGAGVRPQGGDVDGMLAQVRDVISAVDSKTPLSHNMTNLVRIPHPRLAMYE